MKVINGKRISYRNIVINELIIRDGINCNICNKAIIDRLGLEIDHKIPLYSNGFNVIGNLQLTHTQCHRFKDLELRKNNPIIHKQYYKVNQIKRKMPLAGYKLDAYLIAREKIMSLISKGMNRTKIAQELNVSRPTVYGILNRTE